MLLTENGFLDCNASALEMFVIASKEAFRALHPADISPRLQPGGRPSMETANEAIRQAWEQGFQRFEWVHRRSHGQEFPAEVVLSPVCKNGQGVLLASVRDITERKEAEAVLKQERDFSEDILQGSPAIICGISPDGRAMFLNPAGERITGYSALELKNRNWWETLYPGAEYQQVVKLLEAFRSGEVADHEMTLTARDGSQHIVSWNSINRRDEAGKLQEIIGFGMEVTERRRTEAALRQSEERFRELVEHLNDGFVVLDLDLRVSYINAHMVERMGYQAEEVLGASWLGFLEPSVRADFQARMVRRRQGISEHYEMLLLRKDGSPARFAVSGNPLRDTTGQVIGAYAILSDITEQKRIEAEVEAGRARLRAVFDNGVVGITMMDLKGRLLDFNQRWLELLGYSPEELKALRNVDVTHPEDVGATRAAMAELCRGDSKGVLLEKRLIRKDGQIFWVLLSATPVRGADGRVEAIVGMATDITGRKQTQAALKQDEARLKALMRVHECKATSEREMLQVAVKEAVRLAESQAGCLQFLDQDQQPLERVTWSEKAAEPCPFHENLAPSDGRMDCVQLRGPVFRNGPQPGGEPSPGPRHLSVPIFDGGQIVAVANVCNKGEGYHDRDAKQLTLFMGGVWNRLRRDRAEADLKASEERYRLFYREAPLGIFQMDEAGVLLSCNDKLAEFFEASPDQLVGLNLFDFLQNPGVGAALREALEGRTGFFEGFYLSRLGTKEAYGRLFAYRLQSEAGLSLGVYGIVEDLRAWKRAGEEAWKAEQDYRHLFEHALEGLYQSTPEGQLIKANPAVAKLLGFDSLEELMDSMASDVSSNYADPSRREDYKNILERDGSVRGFEFQARRKDGSLAWLSDSAYSVKNEEGKTLYYAGFLEDVSARKRAEELRVAKDAAEAANKAKSAFLAHMSHEIRTPLNAIIGYSELLKDEVKEAQARQYLGAIITSGRTLLSLISDILDLSRIEAGRLDLQFGPVSPRALAHEIRQMFALKCKEKGLQLEIELDQTLPSALIMDEVRLRQLLVNLVGNAVKFTETGSVRISLRRAAMETGTSHLDLECVVSDTGMGIAEDQQHAIFDAFRQQNGQDAARFGGSGLGLAITRRLTEMMGGEIHLVSQPGVGSTFTVRFPEVAVSPLEALQDLAEPEDEPNLAFDPAGILLVDDIQTNRDLLRSFMGSHPFRIHEAENGVEALETAARCQPDLILMDLRMPVMDGREATRELKRNPRLSHIPVVVLTASVMPEDEAAVRECGIAGLLRKPVSQATLLRELGRHLPSRPIKPPPVDTAFAPLAQAALDTLPELLARLETVDLERWEKLRHGFVFQRLAEFGQEMAEAGLRYRAPVLQAWGETLVNQATAFDMERLPGTLEGFPGMVADLRSLLPAPRKGRHP